MSGFHGIKAKIPKMAVRAGVVIEAHDDAEMPEQILCATYVSYLDVASASRVDPFLTAFLEAGDGDAAPLPKEYTNMKVASPS